MIQYGYSLRTRERKCPRGHFLEDLKSGLTALKRMGDGIVLMGDFNQDVRSKEIEDWKQELGLDDKLLERDQQMYIYDSYIGRIQEVLNKQTVILTDWWINQLNSGIRRPTTLQYVDFF